MTKIESLKSPPSGVERLLQVLSFSDCWYKRSWLNVFLGEGLPAESCKTLLSDIKGGFPELEKTLRGLQIRQDLAETFITKVCDVVCGGVLCCYVCEHLLL